MRTSFSTFGRLIKRSAHERDLLVEIGLDRNSRHQWPKQRLRVHVKPSACLVPLGHLENERDADRRGNPRHHHPDPAAMPDSAQSMHDGLHNLAQERLSVGLPGNRACIVAVRTSFAE